MTICDRKCDLVVLCAVLSVPLTLFAAYGQCTETATVTFSAPAGWSMTEEANNQVTVTYFGPKAYVIKIFNLFSLRSFE